MRKWVKPMIFVALAIVVGFPVFSMAYYTMVRTSTPQFCASCHMSGSGEVMTSHDVTEHLLATGEPAHGYKDFPNASGKTTRPAKLFGSKD